MRAAAASAPVFSCEQQYSLLDPKSGWPVGAGAVTPLSLLRCVCVLLACWACSGGEGRKTVFQPNSVFLLLLIIRQLESQFVEHVSCLCVRVH